MTSQKFIFSVGEGFVPKFTALGSFYFYYVVVVTAFFKPSDSKKSHNARLGFNFRILAITRGKLLLANTSQNLGVRVFFPTDQLNKLFCSLLKLLS